MSKKTYELETRNIMQGLEEFATFMSFKSDTSGMRILSVESVTLPISTQAIPQQKAQVIAMPIRRLPSNDASDQKLYKSLSFK